MDSESRQKNLFGFSGIEGEMFANMNNSKNGLISQDTINNRKNTLAGQGPWEMAGIIGFQNDQQRYITAKRNEEEQNPVDTTGREPQGYALGKRRRYNNPESTFDNGKWD